MDVVEEQVQGLEAGLVGAAEPHVDAGSGRGVPVVEDDAGVALLGRKLQARKVQHHVLR